MTPEQQSLELSRDILKEKKSERRFKYVRLGVVAALVLGYGIGLVSAFGSFSDDAAAEPYVSLVRMNGEIGPGKEASAESLNPLLTRAFEDKHAVGVVLVVNSPGGTPVQASLIHDRILQLRKVHPGKKLVVVGEDMLTSGAYLVAVAADKIVVNRSTVAGSIGVISRGFGFTGAMEKLGIERRTLTAGSNKNRMDPFGPVEAGDTVKLERVLGQIHDHFTDTVKAGRQGRLKASPDDLFTGDFWTGGEAVELGLVDELSDLPSVLRDEFRVKRTREYAHPRGLLEVLGSGIGAKLQTAVTVSTTQTPQLLPR
jgi:protease IV